MEKTNSGQINVRLPDDLGDWLVMVERVSGINKSILIRMALTDFREKAQKGNMLSLEFDVPTIGDPLLNEARSDNDLADKIRVSAPASGETAYRTSRKKKTGARPPGRISSISIPSSGADAAK